MNDLDLPSPWVRLNFDGPRTPWREAGGPPQDTRWGKK